MTFDEELRYKVEATKSYLNCPNDNYLFLDLRPALEALLDARRALAAGDAVAARQERHRRLRLLRAHAALDSRA